MTHRLWFRLNESYRFTHTAIYDSFLTKKLSYGPFPIFMIFRLILKNISNKDSLEVQENRIVFLKLSKFQILKQLKKNWYPSQKLFKKWTKMFPLGHARVNFGNEVNFRSFSGLKNLIKCVFLILLRELMHHPLERILHIQKCCKY